jgi:hypothetical protein
MGTSHWDVQMKLHGLRTASSCSGVKLLHVLLVRILSQCNHALHSSITCIVQFRSSKMLLRRVKLANGQ